MSLFSFASWIAEERKRARKKLKSQPVDVKAHLNFIAGELNILRRLSSRLRRGR